MKKAITQDKSITFYNEKYSEHYHSVSGALEEAFEKFARPARIKDGMRILDICFGLGYNSLAAISLANVEIIALENDRTILKQIKGIQMPANYKVGNTKIKNIETDYEKIKVAAEKLQYADDKTKIRIIIGDARRTIKKMEGKFDVCFLDPFSPKRCPELWTREFFEDIRRIMARKGALTTYSCAGIVRRNLENAGFMAADGPSIGRKAPSTIAYSL